MSYLKLKDNSFESYFNMKEVKTNSLQTCFVFLRRNVYTALMYFTSYPLYNQLSNQSPPPENKQ